MRADLFLMRHLEISHLSGGFLKDLEEGIYDCFDSLSRLEALLSKIAHEVDVKLQDLSTDLTDLCVHVILLFRQTVYVLVILVDLQLNLL